MRTMRTKIHTVYKNSKGEKVPGVTTIIGLLDKSGPLMHWAWKLGCEGKDYKKARDKAADSGTLCHYLIECDSLEIQLDKEYLKEFTQTDIEKAETGYLAYLEWKKTNIDKILHAEYQGACDKYGGTIDCIARLKNGKTALIDYKTGGVYDSAYYQVAAYEKLSPVSIEEKMILQINKEDGLFTLHQLGNLDKHFEVFKHLLEIYYLKKEIK